MLTVALLAAALLADPPAAPAAPPPAGPPPAATPVSADAMAKDPRMIAAIRHANALADRRCGTIGGVVDISARAEATRCRRQMIATAKLDAEGEIEGH